MAKWGGLSRHVLLYLAFSVVHVRAQVFDGTTAHQDNEFSDHAGTS